VRGKGEKGNRGENGGGETQGVGEGGHHRHESDAGKQSPARRSPISTERRCRNRDGVGTIAVVGPLRLHPLNTTKVIWLNAAFIAVVAKNRRRDGMRHNARRRGTLPRSNADAKRCESR